MANVSVIPEDYDGLKKEYVIIRKELDIVNQEVYGNRRQIKVLEALQIEYQNEIDILQSEENKEKQKLEETVSHLEETLNNLRSKHNENVQVLEHALTKLEGENEELKQEIELLKKTNTSVSLGDDAGKLIDELVNLKEENEALLEDHEELKLTFDTIQKTNIALEQNLKEYKEELLDVKESLSCKRNELNEANILIQKLNDEIYCLKNELESFRSQPLDKESKGNSLFAEVDDRRVYLQKTIGNMKAEYISMKQERANFINAIHHLKVDNKMLLDRWNSDMLEKEEDEDVVLNSYKHRVKILENLVEKYKVDLAAKPVVISTGDFEEFEFYQIMLNNKSKEIEELREQLSSKTLTQTLLSCSLKEANEEKRKWRLEASQKQYELELATKLIPGGETSDACKKIKQDNQLSTTSKVTDNTTINESVKIIKDEACAKFVDKDVITIDDDNSIETDVSTEKSADVSELEDADSHQLSGELSEAEEMTETDKLKDESTEIVSYNEEAKENIIDNQASVSDDIKIEYSKKVTFSENTVSPKITDRSNMRGGRRVIVPKPVYIFSNLN